MLIYPEVQQRAREEVDRVCGDARLPTIDDDLPYIRACIKESLRVSFSFSSEGTPHYLPTVLIHLHT